jgi:acyl carrier protein
MPATSDTEVRLAALWRDVLGINDDVAPDDDFFSLGGNSLGAMRLMFRIRETFGTEVALRDFYSAPTLGDCAATIDKNSADTASTPLQTISRVDRHQPLGPDSAARSAD